MEYDLNRENNRYRFDSFGNVGEPTELDVVVKDRISTEVNTLDVIKDNKQYFYNNIKHLNCYYFNNSIVKLLGQPIPIYTIKGDDTYRGGVERTYSYLYKVSFEESWRSFGTAILIEQSDIINIDIAEQVHLPIKEFQIVKIILNTNVDGWYPDENYDVILRRDVDDVLIKENIMYHDSMNIENDHILYQPDNYIVDGSILNLECIHAWGVDVEILVNFKV